MQEIASILDAALRCILTGRNIIPPSKTGAAPLVCRARGIYALLCLKQYNTCTMQVCIEQREWLRFCSCVIAIDFFIYGMVIVIETEKNIDDLTLLVGTCIYTGCHKIIVSFLKEFSVFFIPSLASLHFFLDKYLWTFPLLGV